MSQKDDPVARAMEGTASLIGKGLFAAAAGTTAFIAKKLQVPPEEQLRRSGSAPVWGEEIVGVLCNNCETPNETYAEVCFRCGSAITCAADSEGNTVNQNVRMTLDELKAKFKEWDESLPGDWRFW